MTSSQEELQLLGHPSPSSRTSSSVTASFLGWGGHREGGGQDTLRCPPAPSATPSLPHRLQDALEKETTATTQRSTQRVLDGKVVTETKEVKVRTY